MSVREQGVQRGWDECWSEACVSRDEWRSVAAGSSWPADWWAESVGKKKKNRTKAETHTWSKSRSVKCRATLDGKPGKMNCRLMMWWEAGVLNWVEWWAEGETKDQRSVQRHRIKIYNQVLQPFVSRTEEVPLTVSHFRVCILWRTRPLWSSKASPSETLLTSSAVVKWDDLFFGAYSCITRCFTLTSWFLTPRPAKVTIYATWCRHFLSFFLLYRVCKESWDMWGHEGS